MGTHPIFESDFDCLTVLDENFVIGPIKKRDQMSRIDLLKKELKKLEQTFPESHKRLYIKAPSLDELQVNFKDSNRGHVIICNISEDYPDSQPLWFSESENAVICQVLEELDSGEVEITPPKQLEKSVAYLLRRLCELFNIDVAVEPNPAPIEIDDVVEEAAPADDVMIISSDEEDLELVLEEVDTTKKTEDGMSLEQIKKLERIRNAQNGGSSGDRGGCTPSSIQATDRLMKEIKSIYKSQSFKDGNYSIDIVHDNIYEWNVSLLKVDPDSQLAKDLAALSAKQGKAACVQLSLHFESSFPFSPPFIRVVSPVIKGGYVLSGGAICMELLTKQGWSSAYSIESVIMQIAATFVKGKARVIHQQNPGATYSLTKAQQSHRNLVQLHNKSGWYTPPPGDG